MSKNKNSLLKLFVESVLREAATPVATAVQQGLALYIQDIGSGTKFVLYKPQHYIEFLKENPAVNMADDPAGIVAFFQTAAGPADSCSGASEVSVSSAQKGYGPLMYDIVMSHTGLIMADRSNITPAAANIWSYYAKRTDVEKVALDANDCKTFDDQPALNYAFKMVQPVNYAQLTANHNACVKSLDPSDASGFVQNLPAVGVAFFDSVYA